MSFINNSLMIYTNSSITTSSVFFYRKDPESKIIPCFLFLQLSLIYFFLYLRYPFYFDRYVISHCYLPPLLKRFLTWKWHVESKIKIPLWLLQMKIDIPGKDGSSVRTGRLEQVKKKTRFSRYIIRNIVTGTKVRCK